MSNPINPDSPSAPGSRAPKSGRKHIDPTKYQMDTVPAELVAKIAQMRLEPRPKEVLHPPPLFDERPIIGRLRRFGVWASRHKIALAVGAFVGLCVAVTVWSMRGSTQTPVRVDERGSTQEDPAAPPAEPQAIPVSTNAPSTPVAVSTAPVSIPKSQAPESSNASSIVPSAQVRTSAPSKPTSTAVPSERMAPPAVNSPKPGSSPAAKTRGEANSDTDVTDAPFARKRPKSSLR